MESLRRIGSLATNTYRELVRSKVLYGVIFFAIMLILISALFGSVTIGDQILVVKDFGLFSISLFSVAFAVIAGASLLHKELSRKTIYNILSKPVHRFEFLWGKYLGMLLAQALMIGLMGSGLLLFTYALDGNLDLLLIYAYFGIFLELSVVCAAAIFFSAIVVTPILSGLFALGIFLAGRSVEYLLYFINEGSVSGFGAKLLHTMYVMLPHLVKVNLNSAVVYRNFSALSSERIVWAGLYTLGYAGVLMILAGIFFRRRDFN